jgi:hypothetical protein
LAPIADLAQRYGVAVLMISHLNKATTMQALYRVTGSVAFVAAARSAFGVVRDPNDPTKERRFLLPLKSNLGKDRGGLAYRITELGEGCPRVEWEAEPVEVDMDELAAQSTSTPRERGKRAATDEAAEWLGKQLGAGPVAAADMWRRSERAGLSRRQISRAKAALSIETEPMGYGGAWHWRLPPISEASKSPEQSGTVVRASVMRANVSESGNLSGNNKGGTFAAVSHSAGWSGKSQSESDLHGFSEAGNAPTSTTPSGGDEVVV